MDDASRFITGYGVFEHAAAQNAIDVLYGAIEDHSRPASILTDRGTQFYASESGIKRKGTGMYEQELVRLDIRQILARVCHPQTNGKLERFHGEIQAKLHLFRNIDDLFDWFNNVRPHMSLDLKTPAVAFAEKVPPEGIVTDRQTGEQYVVSSGNGGVGG